MRRSGSVHGPLDYNRAMKTQLLVLLLVAATVAAAPAWGLARAREAAPQASHRVTAAVRAGGLSLDEAVARAEKQYNARAVRAEEKRKGDRRVYRIRLLGADGRVFEITVDADTGRTE